MFESYLKLPVSFPTLTGSIVTFNAQYALPLKSHKIALTATQSGSGTPSPDNVRTINGYSAINISATAKNIMPDDVAFTNNYYLKSDGTITYSNAWKLSDYIIIPKVENLSIDYVNFPTSAGNVVYGFFDSEQVFISGVNATNHTIQVPSNACYMRLSIRKDAENIQLEIGTTTSAYEAYEGQSVTIQIGSTVYGGEYDARTGVLTVTHDYLNLGSLNWSDVNSTNDTSSTGLSGLIKPPPTNNNKVNMLCTSFEVVARNAISDITILVNTSSTIIIRYSGYAGYTGTQVKSALSGIYIAYELATPTTIQLPPCPIDTIANSVNNIWADTGDTTLQYPKFG